MASSHSSIKGSDCNPPARAGKGGADDPHPGKGAKGGDGIKGAKGNGNKGKGKY